MTILLRAKPNLAGSDHSDAASRRTSQRHRSLVTGLSGSVVHRPPELEWVEPILEATTTLQVATASSISGRRRPKPVAESFHRIRPRLPGPFPAGHRRRASSGHRIPQPYDELVQYSTSSTSTGPRNRRVVRGPGPAGAQLSAERSAGAHPY